jgi:hypothetical protein
MAGGSLFVSYALLREIMRHHQHTLRRPKYIDHLIATSIIGATCSVLFFDGALPSLLLKGSVVGLTAGMFIWYAGLVMNSTKHANIHYEPGVSNDEKARFEAQDQIEALAHTLSSKNGFGFEVRDPRGIF